MASTQTYNIPTYIFIYYYVNLSPLVSKINCVNLSFTGFDTDLTKIEAAAVLLMIAR